MLEKLILKSLNKDVQSIIDLSNFPNGGGESSYNLGDIMTRIVYRIGEDEFLKLVLKFLRKNIQGVNLLWTLVWNTGITIMILFRDNKRLIIEFPKLNKILENQGD